MTIRISFSDNAVRVAVEIDGKIESAITELPQREWVGLTDEEINNVKHVYDWSAAWTLDDFARVIEAKLKEKNT